MFPQIGEHLPPSQKLLLTEHASTRKPRSRWATSLRWSESACVPKTYCFPPPPHHHSCSRKKMNINERSTHHMAKQENINRNRSMHCDAEHVTDIFGVYSI